MSLVLLNKVLDHLFRIDRIFCQPQGLLLILGASGAGKIMLSRSDGADGKGRFIIDEPNERGSGFPKRMNKKLANSEGKEGAQRQGPMLDTNEKRGGMEEEQLHINEGLDKIAEDPAEARATGEALGTVTKNAEKKMKDERDEVERDKAEAEEDKDLCCVDRDEEEEVGKDAEDWDLLPPNK